MKKKKLLPLSTSSSSKKQVEEDASGEHRLRKFRIKEKRISNLSIPNRFVGVIPTMYPLKLCNEIWRDLMKMDEEDYQCRVLLKLTNR